MVWGEILEVLSNLSLYEINLLINLILWDLFSGALLATADEKIIAALIIIIIWIN